MAEHQTRRRRRRIARSDETISSKRFTAFRRPNHNSGKTVIN
jgi:hypothetical protein